MASVPVQRESLIILADDVTGTIPGDMHLAFAWNLDQYLVRCTKHAGQPQMSVQQAIAIALAHDQDVRIHDVVENAEMSTAASYVADVTSG